MSASVEREQVSAPSTVPTEMPAPVVVARAEPGEVDVAAVLAATDTVVQEADAWSADALTKARALLVAQDVASFRARFTADGVYVAPEDAEAKYRAAAEAKYRAQAIEKARALLDGVPAMLEALDGAMAASETLPSEAWLARKRAGDRLLAKVADTVATGEARALLAGRSLGEVAGIYAAATDEGDRELVRLIEREVLGGWPTVRLREPATAAEAASALGQLRGAIAARRAARVPVALREAKARLLAGWTVTKATSARYLLEGRIP